MPGSRAIAALVWQWAQRVERLLEFSASENGRKENMGLGNLGDLGDLSNLNLDQLTQYLPNQNFPASKDEVVSEIQNNNAPQEVIDQVKNSSNDTFNNAGEVLETVRGNR
jgi:hypothetical protein